MRNKLNVKLPEEHRRFSLGGVYQVMVRIMPTTAQQLQASKLYAVNERRDGFFQLADDTYCCIQDQESSFWEVVP